MEFTFEESKIVLPYLSLQEIISEITVDNKYAYLRLKNNKMILIIDLNTLSIV
jgi:hypothetical protein